MQKLSLGFQFLNPVWILGTGSGPVKHRANPTNVLSSTAPGGRKPKSHPQALSCRAASTYPQMPRVSISRMTAKPHVAVIGAGAFGGWTALHLRDGGARVTLLDAWGPGNSRASSGGETRVMRGAYGLDQASTEMAARALKLWEDYERRSKRTLLHRSGVLWMATGDDVFESGSVELCRATTINFQELSTPVVRKVLQQIN